MADLILGVCILLRVWDQVMEVFIHLCNVNIVGYFTTIYYIATCFGRTTIFKKKYINGQGFSIDNGSVVYNIVDIIDTDIYIYRYI
jgi:hypothetical protein